jgi:hypothetical protein
MAIMNAGQRAHPEPTMHKNFLARELEVCDLSGWMELLGLLTVNQAQKNHPN